MSKDIIGLASDCDATKLIKLDKKSFVVDIGAYIGEFSQYILDTYNCKIDAYEPQVGIFMLRNKNVRFVNSAVLDGSSAHIDSNGTSTSLFTNGNIMVKTVDIKDVTKKHINLLKINAEGSEIIILNRANLDNVDQILVEFHRFRNDINITNKDIDNIIKKIKNAGFKAHLIHEKSPTYFFTKL